MTGPTSAPPPAPPSDIGATDLESAELRDLSRTVAHIDWLLVILVLLYQAFQESSIEDAIPVYAGIAVFGCVIAGLHHLSLVQRRTRWLLAVETWLMIVFITWIIYHTGSVHGPLLSLYYLPIVTSALTLGQKLTLLEVGLIAACYMLLGHLTEPAFLTTLSAGDFAAEMGPMLLVAYITTMLSLDILNAMAKIKLISETDALTGVYNMRAFQNIANRDLGLAARYKRTLSLLMIDSDNLKNVNDTWGHDAGDRLILHVVHCIRSELRSTDVVARYGGDEFLCMLPETDIAAAAQVAERIRRRIAAEPVDLGSTAVTTTVSVGLSAFPQHGARVDQLTKNSDRALYLSKAQGRNRVVIFEPA